MIDVGKANAIDGMNHGLADLQRTVIHQPDAILINHGDFQERLDQFVENYAKAVIEKSSKEERRCHLRRWSM